MYMKSFWEEENPKMISGVFFCFFFFSFIIYLFIFLLHHMAYRILDPRPGIEPVPPGLETWRQHQGRSFSGVV